MLNRVMLIGNRGNDPDVRQTQAGKLVASIRLATSERRGGEERTQWHTVVLWGRLAEVARDYLRKGARVYVEGRLEYSSWRDRDGRERRTTEIVASRVIMLDSRGSRQGEDRQAGDPFCEQEEEIEW